MKLNKFKISRPAKKNTRKLKCAITLPINGSDVLQIHKKSVSIRTSSPTTPPRVAAAAVALVQNSRESPK